jgi:hypothetical protein
MDVITEWTDPITNKKYDNHDDYFILNGYKYHSTTIRKMILLSEIGKYLNSSLEKFMNKSLEEHIYKESDDEDEDVLINEVNQIRGRSKKRGRTECKISSILKCPITNKGLSCPEIYNIWIHFSESKSNVFNKVF